MTVQELITLLSRLDPKLRVLRPGYEGGLADIYELRELSVRLNVNKGWYRGPHEEADIGQ